MATSLLIRMPSAKRMGAKCMGVLRVWKPLIMPAVASDGSGSDSDTASDAGSIPNGSQN